MTPEPVDALAWAFSKIDEPHRHHRHCIHNLSWQEQFDQRRRSIDGSMLTEEQARILGMNKGIVVITPDDWEIDVPDLDWSRLDSHLEEDT